MQKPDVLLKFFFLSKVRREKDIRFGRIVTKAKHKQTMNVLAIVALSQLTLTVTSHQ